MSQIISKSDWRCFRELSRDRFSNSYKEKKTFLVLKYLFFFLSAMQSGGTYIHIERKASDRRSDIRSELNVEERREAASASPKNFTRRSVRTGVVGFMVLP